MTRVLLKKKKILKKKKKRKEYKQNAALGGRRDAPPLTLLRGRPGHRRGLEEGFPSAGRGCSGFPGHCAAAKATARRLFWSLLPGEGFALHSRLHITAPPGTERAGGGKTTAKASPSYPPETRSRRASGAASGWGRRAERGEREGSGAGGREKPSPRCPRPAVIPGCMRAAGGRPCLRLCAAAAGRGGTDAPGRGTRGDPGPSRTPPPLPPRPATRTPPPYGTGEGSRARTARGSPRAGGVCATHTSTCTRRALH